MRRCPFRFIVDFMDCLPAVIAIITTETRR